MGCLVAHRGHGIIFVCGIEEPGELRLTVAHEAAHFLVDYLLPRQHMINALGDRIAEVLDGLRPAAHEERVHAILSHVRLGPHVHLLPRADTDEDSDPFAAHTEDRADRLALELLAPRERVISLLQNLSVGEAVSANEASSALAAYFGLPVHASEWIIQQMSQHRPASFLADALMAIRGRR
jgi:Zn-dependent peptidase ImmA (M78 family)